MIPSGKWETQDRVLEQWGPLKEQNTERRAKLLLMLEAVQREKI